MSSNFNSSFSKNDDVKNLQYDDSAFWFYSTAILSLSVLILLINIIWSYFSFQQKVSSSKRKLPKTAHFQSKLSHSLSTHKSKSRIYKKLAILGVLVYFLATTYKMTTLSKDFKSFDPYEVLGIQRGVEEKEIKAAYRTMARLHHPDLNPGDPEAANRFIQVNKAYECLTHAEKKELCEKYGNPDGKSNYQVGVAFPSILLKKENTKLTLCLFFVVFFISILTYLISLQSSANKNKWGVSENTMKGCFNYFKNENMIFNNVIEMMSISQELAPILMVKPGQIKALNLIKDPKIKRTLSRKEFHFFQKPFYLINHYMSSDEQLDPCLISEMKFIQEQSIGLFLSFFDVGMEFFMLSKQYTKIWEKPLSPNVLKTLCRFSQHFVQGISLHESPLLQLPHIDRGNIKRIDKKVNAKNFQNLLQEDSEKREKLLGLFSEVQQKDITSALSCISAIQLEMNCFVQINEEERSYEIRANDIFTVEMKISRNNKHTHYIYSKKLLFLKLERLSVLVYSKLTKNVLFYETNFSQEKEITLSFQQGAGMVGTIDLIVLVESDSYLGVGLEREFQININRPQKFSEYILHPEDEEALKKPSLLTRLLQDNEGGDIGSDEELEEEEEEEERQEGNDQEKVPEEEEEPEVQDDSSDIREEK